VYSPTFKGPIEGYVANFATKHGWRVSRLHQREDIIQEAYLIFDRCVKAYPDVETPQHFMALFKRAWSNHFTDMANDDTRSRVICQHTEFETDDLTVSFEPVGELDGDGYLAVMLRQAPREIGMVLNLFLNAPQEMRDIALGAWSGKRDTRCKAGGSKRICQMLGLDPSKDVMRAVEEYFQQ